MYKKVLKDFSVIKIMNVKKHSYAKQMAYYVLSIGYAKLFLNKFVYLMSNYTYDMNKVEYFNMFL